jgi:hypothetical protein
MISPSSPAAAISSADFAPSSTTRTIWLMPARPAEPGFLAAFWSMVKV